MKKNKDKLLLYVLAYFFAVDIIYDIIVMLLKLFLKYSLLNGVGVPDVSVVLLTLVIMGGVLVYFVISVIDLFKKYS